MRILLTGGAGFIGSHLARRLLREGHEVDIIDNLSTGLRDNVPPGAELLELDVTERELAQRLPERSYGAVLHLAGQSAGEKSFDDPLYDFDANARSTLLLAEWARGRGVSHFLHASSMGVYGQPTRLPVAEDEPTRPLSFYGQSKLAAEGALAVCGQLGLRCVSVRMFSVYGPGQNLADLRQGMVSIFLAYLLRGEPIPVKGSLERVRDFVYIEDAVEGWMRLLHSPLQGPVNLGTGLPTSVAELIEQLREATGSRLGASSSGSTPGDQFAVFADTARLERELGWKPAITLREGLARMVAWARKGAS